MKQNSFIEINAAAEIMLFCYLLLYSSLLTETYVNGFYSCSNLDKNV